MECPICQQVFKNVNGLAKHIHNQHKKYNRKTFYDTFLASENDGKCKTCGKQTTFRNISKGYLTFCSVRCRSNDPGIKEKLSNFAKGRKQSKETIAKRIANTDKEIKEYNRIKSLQERYGEDVTNPSQTPTYREKYRKTSLKNWGTLHPSSAPESFRTRKRYKKRTVTINGYTFSDIQGYEDIFLEQLEKLFPHVSYENLLEERNKTLFREGGSVHYPDFYSKKHNHMFEVKSAWTFEMNKEDVLLKKAEAERQGYTYNIIVWKRRNSKPYII
jgi:endogenous inhibitor of DNA gyrase (YacG/DUF329 family)